MHGIPTTYEGVRFRSRLEARWAAFFDRLRWPWDYEPIDLDGYIPDFVLPFEAGNLLVEVKPAHDLEELRAAARKIDASGWQGEALVVGASLFDESLLGLFGEPEEGPEGPQRFWGEGRAITCLSCGRASVVCVEQSWRCRACGIDDGNAHMGGIDLRDTWNDAGNRVQWRAA